MQMVVQRELRAAARRSGSYWARVGAGAFAALALMQGTGNVRNGRDLFFTAVVLAFIFCLFEGARRAAGSVANEKTEGTLELLFLTPLTGPELLRGKFAAIAISAFQMALAAVPILAASLLLGGISAGEFLRALIALAHTLALVIAIGIRWSVKAKDGQAALTGILIFLAFTTGFFAGFAYSIPFLRGINPMTPLVSISDAVYAQAPFGFWISVALWQTFTWYSLQTLGDRLTTAVKSQQEEVFAAAAPMIYALDANLMPREFVPLRKADAPRWFASNPIEWFTLRDMGMHSGRHGVLIFSIALGLLGILLPPLGQVVAAIAIAGLVFTLSVAAARSMARLKESGALELILTTPLNERAILKGHQRGLRKLFFWPFVVWTAVIVLLFFKSEMEREGAFYISGFIVVSIWLLVWMTPWFAAAAALKSKTPARAVGWTVFVVLVFPRAFFCWLGDAVFFGVIGPFVRDYVIKNFRRLVAERFTS
jgi:ABC-type transport system involved in multi-copper enzyme maturation permease subunit